MLVTASKGSMNPELWMATGGSSFSSGSILWISKLGVISSRSLLSLSSAFSASQPLMKKVFFVPAIWLTVPCFSLCQTR